MTTDHTFIFAFDQKQQKSFYKHKHYALAYTFMSGYYDRLNV